MDGTAFSRGLSPLDNKDNDVKSPHIVIANGSRALAHPDIDFDMELDEQSLTPCSTRAVTSITPSPGAALADVITLVSTEPPLGAPPAAKAKAKRRANKSRKVEVMSPTS